ncbi:MAG: recombinase zinc beta ribbon domain-containing protein [Bacilli bacterium]|nr:recombinase zinc beta ribbon domain-containing protein [Bacilli bacterium]
MVKDLSRLGHNHIEVNKYIEDIFPSLNVRVLSINDNYDSLKTKNSNGEDILSGYFKCKDCGESMYIKKGKNKDYYYCRSYITNGLCTNHSIEKNKLYDEILKQMNLKRVESKEIKKLTRNRIVKYIDNIFIHEDKSIEINFKEDINSI